MVQVCGVWDRNSNRKRRECRREPGVWGVGVTSQVTVPTSNPNRVRYGHKGTRRGNCNRGEPCEGVCGTVKPVCNPAAVWGIAPTIQVAVNSGCVWVKYNAVRTWEHVLQRCHVSGTKRATVNQEPAVKNVRVKPQGFEPGQCNQAKHNRIVVKAGRACKVLWGKAGPTSVALLNATGTIRTCPKGTRTVE